MAKRIKNNTLVDKTWAGQEILAGQYYEIQPTEEIKWANDSILLSAIGISEAIVNNGSADILDINAAINYLKDILPKEVVTQFEKDDKMLKLACAKASVQSDGYATIELKIPGTPGSGDGRYVDAGRIWFSESHFDDKVEKIEIVDIDNLLGYGSGTVVRTWHDDEAEANNEGWYIPKAVSGVAVDSMGGYGFIPAGFYLRIKAKKGESITTGNVYLNLKWGKQE